MKSRLGQGTIAELYLPVAPGEPASADARPIKAHVPFSINKKLAILTVDDDPLVALNTSALLEELGHTVYSAPSALHALDILRREKKIDLMITDQLMPDMTGSELASRIRAENSHMPIILATGYAELAPGEGEGLPRLAKPFSQRELGRGDRPRREVLKRLPSSPHIQVLRSKALIRTAHRRPDGCAKICAKREKNMDDTAAQRAAEWLLAEHQAGHRFTTLGPPAAPASISDAYDIQDRYVALLRRESGEPAGYKVGLTSATMQAFCRIDHPIAGVVLGLARAPVRRQDTALGFRSARP